MNTGHHHNLVDMLGQMTRLDMARMRLLLVRGAGRKKAYQDCPPMELGFRPFLLSTPDTPEFFLRPTATDCGPMASALRNFLIDNN